MLNNVKANVPGILLAFLNISTQDRKKEEEDQAAPTWEKQKLKKEKKKEKKKKGFRKNLTNFHLHLGHMASSGCKVDDNRRVRDEKGRQDINWQYLLGFQSLWQILVYSRRGLHSPL